jgi:hypothetical protein
MEPLNPSGWFIPNSLGYLDNPGPVPLSQLMDGQFCPSTLRMHYCIIEVDIDMVISEWLDEWRIPSIPREVPEGPTEGEVAQAETQPP